MRPLNLVLHFHSKFGRIYWKPIGSTYPEKCFALKNIRYIFQDNNLLEPIFIVNRLNHFLNFLRHIGQRIRQPPHHTVELSKRLFLVDAAFDLEVFMDKFSLTFSGATTRVGAAFPGSSPLHSFGSLVIERTRCHRPRSYGPSRSFPFSSPFHLIRFKVFIYSNILGP